MKFTKIFVTLMILSAFVLNACKETDKNPNPTGTGKTNSEKLTAHNWILTTATFNPPLVVTIGTNTQTYTNLFDIPLIEACQKDNSIIFNIDSTMTVDNGPLKCGTEPQTAKDGNWKFINNETQIEITNSAYFSLINANKVVLSTVTVSETEMKGTTPYTFTNPITSEVTTSTIAFTFTIQK